MRNRQDAFFEERTPPSQWDYSFVDSYRKVYQSCKDNGNEELKHAAWINLRHGEARRDYYTGLLKEFKNFEQLDQMPNYDLKEAKCEIYKLTLSDNVNLGMMPRCLNSLWKDVQNVNPRVLCQNEAGNINMGACLNVSMHEDLYEFAWFCHLALDMETSLAKNEGLIFVDEELKTQSCFVELHRNRIH